MPRKSRLEQLAQQVLRKLEWTDEATAKDAVPLSTSQLRNLVAAADRVVQGHYGECVDCDRSIPLQRLEVCPEAIRCVQCQTLHEARSTGHDHGSFRHAS